jgi:hypothetical protein
MTTNNKFIELLSAPRESSVLKVLNWGTATSLASLFATKSLGPHCSADWYKKTGALKEVSSFFIRDLDYSGKVNSDTLLELTLFINILVSLFGKDIEWINSNLKRAYYTELPPGKEVYPHADNLSYFDNIVRFQIYLNEFDETCQVVENGIAVPYVFGQVRSFNLTEIHSASNTGSTTLKLIVFDMNKHAVKS